MAAQTLDYEFPTQRWSALVEFCVCLLSMSFFIGAVAERCAGYDGPIIVDLNPDNGRNDVLTRSAHNWQVRGDQPAIFSAGTVLVNLEVLDSPEAKLVSGWWKAGYDYPANLCSDGVTTNQPGVCLQLTLAGLPAGKHSLVTWHNAWESSRDILESPDSLVVELGLSTNDGAEPNWLSRLEVLPSVRVLHNDLASSAYIEFDVKAEQVVTIKITPTNSNGHAILNGFALNVPDPRQTIRLALPADGDLHVLEQPELKWHWPTCMEQYSDSTRDSAENVQESPILIDNQSSENDKRENGIEDYKIQYHVYLGTDAERVARATRSDTEYQGVTTEPSWHTDLVDHMSDYYWRVDCQLRNEAAVLGRVRKFRISRLAFPGAEGYGRFAIGGRGGRVLHVTNLNDSGPGSLREAVEADGPRTILFQVSGTIELKSKLLIRNPFITIAGQSAPGEGVCVSGYTFGCFGTHDVIMRYLRLRVGDISGQTMDGTGFASTDHSIFDHCSISWSIDEAVSSRSAKNITLQRCIVAEALNVANHHKYESGKGHSFAGSISGDIGSFHHNLLAHCAGRNWSLAGGLDRGGRYAGRLDIRNNVVYNWQHRTNDGGVKALNLVNNLYLPGPASRVFHLLKPDAGSLEDPQQYFVQGNRMEGYHSEVDDNWNKAVVVAPELLDQIRLSTPFCEPYVTTHDVSGLLEEVLSDVGANHAGLDDVDRRIIEDVRSRRASAKGSRTGLPGIIDSQADVGGWPELQSGTPHIDSDHDGLPDQWEIEHGLDPVTPDQNRQLDFGGDTALEIYLSQLARRQSDE